MASFALVMHVCSCEECLLYATVSVSASYVIVCVGKDVLPKNEKVNIETDVTERMHDNNTGPYFCTVCGNWFARKASWRSHKHMCKKENS